MASLGDLPLAAESLTALEAAGPLDLVAGVYADEEAGGTTDLLDAAATALAKHFPAQRAAVLALPVGWRQAALPAIRSWAGAEPASRLCLESRPDADAGQALRTLLSVAGRLEVRGAVLLDATLAGLPPEAIHALLEPVAAGQADCALPAYTRSVTEGTLTTNLLAPLTCALYGRAGQQMVGGCAALSGALLQRLLARTAEAEGWKAPATEIWLTTTALLSDGPVVQVHLGRRPRHPGRPPADLPTIVAETVGPLLTLMGRHREVWQEARDARAVPLIGGPATMLPDQGGVDVERMVRAFRLGLKDLLPVWEQMMPDTTLTDLYPLPFVAPDEFRFAPRLWARVIGDFAVAYRDRRLPSDHLLRALTPLYLGRVAAFLLATRDRSPAEIEQALEEIAGAFEAEKPTLIARWR